MIFSILYTAQRKKKTKKQTKKMDTDVCFVVSPDCFLDFCAQLTKQGCDVIAVNTFCKHPRVWVTNCPMLKNFLIQTESGQLSCSGFNVHIIQNQPKGKTCKRVKNMSYFDLIQLCDRQRPLSWSPPSCLDRIKRMYF